MPSSADVSSRSMRFRDWSCLRYSLMWAYDGPIASHAHVGHYTNLNTSCWLVRQGEVKVTSRGKTVTARPGQWVFVAHPSRHQLFSKDARILSVHFLLTWPNGEPVFKQTQNQILSSANYPQLEKTANSLVRKIRRFMPEPSAYLLEMPCSLSIYLQMQNLLPMWLDAYLQVQEQLGHYPVRPGVLSDRLIDAVTELNRKPLDEKYDESALSLQVGLKRSQLNSLFSKNLGVTPHRYFERRKMEEARQLLLHTEKSVKEISFALGFRYESHFSLWFRRQEKISPSAFRQQVDRMGI